ncbi:MAG: ABC transporter substrate-binding protein [Deltaproteobacteria bacterium]|nr:ABC transporter substrate-binding protein [Deltaproteobacteria bacterium]
MTLPGVTAIALIVKLRLNAWIAVLFLYSLPLLDFAQAGEPTDRIRFVVEQGIEILNNPKFRSKNGKHVYLDRLREVVYPLFDFPEMARRSLGFHWRQLSPEQQKEFVDLFTNLLERSYAGKIDLYDGETVVFTGEVVEDIYARVDSKIVSKKGEEFSVDYKLLRNNGNWRIYDVVVENISLVNNYRSQFNRVISNSSYEELKKRINQKLKELEASHNSNESPA